MTGEAAAGLRRLGAIARRDLLIELSYQFRLGLSFVGVLVAAFVAFYVSELVGSPEQLATFNGTYFDYVLVGLALTAFAGLGVSAFTTQVTQEQGAGTLEALLAGPTRLATLLAGGFIVPLVLTILEVALLVGVGVGLLGTGLTAGQLLLALPVVALTLANFAALGIVSAAVIMLVKRGDPISGPVYQLTLLTSGAIFPVALFPDWLQVLCRLNPAYYGVRALHTALLTDAGAAGITQDLAVLAGFACVGLPVSVWVFAAAVAQAKRLGVLGSY